MALVLLTASVSSCFYAGHVCLKLNCVCGGWREHRVKAGGAVEYDQQKRTRSMCHKESLGVEALGLFLLRI